MGWENKCINKIMKITNGNKRKLLIGSYNVAKGLIDSENIGTYKLEEIKTEVKEKILIYLELLKQIFMGKGPE